MVDSVSVIVDTEFFLPLQEILEAYGCPELIVADAKEPDYSIENITTPAFPDYEFVWFEYITAGLSFGFDGYPLSLSDIPVYVNFVTPEFFMEKYQNSIYLYPFPVELRGAVK
jgi:hypothetical protein